MRRDRFAAIGAAKQWSSMNFVILDTETTDRGSLAHIVEFSCIDREGNHQTAGGAWPSSCGAQ